MVIRRHAARNPPIGRVVGAQLSQSPGAAHAVNGGIKPQRHENLRIGGGATSGTLHRANCLVQGTEVQTFDIRPHDPSHMVVGDRLVETDVAELPLRAIGTAEPRLADCHSRLRRRHQSEIGGWKLKQDGCRWSLRRLRFAVRAHDSVIVPAAPVVQPDFLDFSQALSTEY